MKKYLFLLVCFFIIALSWPDAQAAQIGDTDGNGILTSADARLSLRHAVGLESLEPDAQIAADANNDGKILTDDARTILRACVGLERFTGAFSVDFIDVGQAKSILVQSGGQTMLLDGGNVADGETICTYLTSKGITSLDYVVCTHAHEDHVGGLADVLENFTVTKTVFAPSLTADTNCYEDFIDACLEQGKSPVHPTLASTMSFGDAAVQFFGPAIPDTTDLNDSSIVMKITYEDTAFLFTGDAETASEYAMIEEGFDLSANLLDVGHHGSSTSSSYVFLREVMPEFAVISCGTDNDYGHPHEEVTSRLSDAQVTVYRTDLQGTVQVISNGKALAFYTDNDFKPDIPQPAPDTSETEYIGNLNSKKFHLPTCGSLPAEHNRIYFASREAAIADGYSPCDSCKP